MIGGGVFTSGTGDKIKVDNVDGLGKNAVEAVNLAKKWIDKED
jgi:hypothetical protein